MPADRPAPVPLENVRAAPSAPALARTPTSPPPSEPQLPSPGPPGTSGLALAAATGATISRDASGMSTVSLGASDAPTPGSAPEPTIAREETPRGPSTGGGAQNGGAPGGGGGADVDELAAKVIEKIKDEAHWERVLRGDIIDIP
jgi:hypothetical protein